MQLRQDLITQGSKSGVSPSYVNDFATSTFLRGLLDRETGEVLLVTNTYPKEMRALFRAVQTAQLRRSGPQEDNAYFRQVPVRAAALAPDPHPKSELQQLKETVNQLSQQVAILMEWNQNFQ